MKRFLYRNKCQIAQQLSKKFSFTLLLFAAVLPLHSLSSELSSTEPAHCEYYKPGQKNLYWGDLHVHTAYSLDAYAFGTLKTPRDAYAFAQGHATTLHDGSRVQLDRPLDFTAVTDHAEWFDLMHICTDPQNMEDPYCTRLRKESSVEKGSSLFAD